MTSFALGKIILIAENMCCEVKRKEVFMGIMGEARARGSGKVRSMRLLPEVRSFGV